MGKAPWSVAVWVGLSAACSSSERAVDDASPAPVPRTSAPKSEPTARGPTLAEIANEARTETSVVDLGVDFGGPRVTAMPNPGRYAVAIEARVEQYITRERWRRVRIDSGASIELGPDGVATGCMWGDRDRRATVSKYARGGERESKERSGWRHGLRGQWRPATAGHVEVAFAQRSRSNCEVPSTAPADADPTTLRCTALPAAAPLKTATLACLVVEHLDVIDDVATVIIDGELGAVAVERAVQTRRPPPPDAERWLVLGKAPGLRLTHVRPARGPAKISWAVATVVDPRGPVPPAP